jgi:ribosome-binding factor A
VTQRTDRVADRIRVELSELFLREVRDPRVHLASVSRVEVSRDLGHARVWVSILGEEKDRVEAMEGLERARGFLRSQLGRRLGLRVTPELRFELDRGAQHLQEMSRLLEDLHAGETKPDRDDS